MVKQSQIVLGKPEPLGATVLADGINFAFYAKNATQVSLLLFQKNKNTPKMVVPLSPEKHKTGDIWHIKIEGLENETRYAYQLEGIKSPKDIPLSGKEILLDPYSYAIEGLEKWGNYHKTFPKPVLKSVAIQHDFLWEDDQPINRPLKDCVIYEIHTRGFTQNQNSEVKHKGTYQGIIEKIPYFKELGINTLELLPVHEFDETNCPFNSPDTREQLFNYWGYNTISFFAPKIGYASSNNITKAIQEFKEMVKALHKEGIELILDVVFNHTGEGGVENGKVINLKGIENETYYHVNPDGTYKNFTGCGNTVNTNHPVVRELIIQSLRYWVTEMHVDGFRFDLASILSRGENGEPLENPPISEMIARDPILSKTKIIAEAWDASGLYQIGTFPSYQRWAEWNGPYRDTVRRFIRGEKGLTSSIASRITGSEDIYGASQRKPYHSINFITAHDGFSMMDLVSYNEKHNFHNGERNRDGENDNHSYNNGVEGETLDTKILERRFKQIRNMATLLLLSQGTPLIVAGDEFGRTQKGNNNAWCQDSTLSWVDWSLLKKNHDLFLFWKKLIEFRKQSPHLCREEFFTGEAEHHKSSIPDISWHGTQLNQPDFGGHSRTLSYLISGRISSEEVHPSLFVAMNFWEESLSFNIPNLDWGGPWKVLINTADPTSFIQDKEIYLPLKKDMISVPSFSILVLEKK
ncbi:MAG: isoamylase [bacterium]|jgi:isoamylase